MPTTYPAREEMRGVAGRNAGYGQENGGIPASARRNVGYGQENGGFSADAGKNVRGMQVGFFRIFAA